METAELQEILAQLDNQAVTLVFEADLGNQAKEFIESDLGRHLIGCAKHEVAEAQEALKRVAPWRRRRIQELQNRIWRAEFLLTWLRDLLISGYSAAGALTEAESND